MEDSGLWDPIPVFSSALSQRHALNHLGSNGSWLERCSDETEVEISSPRRTRLHASPTCTWSNLLAAKVDAIEGHRKVGWRRFCVWCQVVVSNKLMSRKVVQSGLLRKDSKREEFRCFGKIQLHEKWCVWQVIIQGLLTRIVWYATCLVEWNLEYHNWPILTIRCLCNQGTSGMYTIGRTVRRPTTLSLLHPATPTKCSGYPWQDRK